MPRRKIYGCEKRPMSEKRLQRLQAQWWLLQPSLKRNRSLLKKSANCIGRIGSSTHPSQTSQTFHDVDGRVYFLFDCRGASDRADASLCFRRIMASDRQKLCMSGQRLDIDADKLQMFLWGSSDQSYFRDAMSATSTWGSAMQLDQVSALPVFMDGAKYLKFLSGKWKRYDFAHLSLCWILL